MSCSDCVKNSAYFCTYTSFSGYEAKYLLVATKEDTADLLTVLLRTLVDLVQGDKANREVVVTMLSGMIRPSGFGSTSIHWGIHLILWWHRLLGTGYTLDKILDLAKFINFFMPIIMWLRNLLSSLFGF